MASTKRQYNGNIASQKWMSSFDKVSRQYVYSYDALNRLKGADYTSTATTNELYSLQNMEYDKNGNITHLERYGAIAFNTSGKATGFGLVDNLTYSYETGANQSNRLLAVADGSNNPTNGQAGDFVEPTTQLGDDNYTPLTNGESPQEGDVGTYEYTGNNPERKGTFDHFEIYTDGNTVNSKGGTEKNPGPTKPGTKTNYQKDKYSVIRKRSPHTVVSGSDGNYNVERNGKKASGFKVVNNAEFEKIRQKVTGD
ncbi:hypothetical protein [Xanthocytophaga agilis]|uniref:Type IV secretion protein Rhs n=1 Tax=Xanthocytophaga agilis TaxID=3048010 RepID=A0AAE3R614_9BACT|nr:hypothetical protein [Xanthocytophaga agilis]MDJ1502074.1 hypothetical protein [Xanthocytophaga agilis]